MIFYFSLRRRYHYQLRIFVEGFSVEGKRMLARCERYFFLWKYKLFPWEMNVFTFRAIFFLLKSDTSGPFSIMRFSPLLKLNLSFSIPLNNQQKNFSGSTEEEGRNKTAQTQKNDDLITISGVFSRYQASKLSTPSSEPHWPKISVQKGLLLEKQRDGIRLRRLARGCGNWVKIPLVRH